MPVTPDSRPWAPNWTPSSGGGTSTNGPATTANLTQTLTLSSPDFGVTLIIKLKVRVTGDLAPSQYTIYYLSPLDVNESQLTLATLTTGITQLPKQFVYKFDITGDNTTNISTPLLYTPDGTVGSRRDYSLGGWMYAVVTASSLAEEWLGEATQAVAVPNFNAANFPPDKTFNSFAVTSTGPDTTGRYLVTATWASPYPQLSRTQNCEIWMFNYRGAGLYENMGVYATPQAPGGTKSVSYELEKDGGGHNVIFYAAELNASRSRFFGKAINAHSSSTIVGGFP